MTRSLQPISTLKVSQRAYAGQQVDPHAWLLDRYRRGPSISCQALLIPMAGRLDVELDGVSPFETSTRLILRALNVHDRPSAVITDNSSDATALRVWLSSRGIAHATVPKALRRMERMRPAMFEIAGTLARSAAELPEHNTSLTLTSDR
ncbi:hypothetical protein [Chenggangzhangella methanolivorans]|uniref:Uncharacterized protein n=1 Tax=Chenggangzhangella methanolivorans TaxID=1437009 RepID=A0A9E6RCZ9_9HYPH|nr:hypothetical protein [Chenggangzhangella methanolivorans]QZO02065.1 hypothetical protein K6K41_12795 [Chenggangzhangella methanolivorans]